jgi:hypothetical protein
MLNFKIIASALVISLAVSYCEAQPETPQAGTINELRNGPSCVTMFSAMGHGPKLRVIGKRKNKPTRYLYNGKEVSTFPEPVQVKVIVSPNCEGDAAMNPTWPDWVKKLQFHFVWELTGKLSKTISDEALGQISESSSAWPEAGRTRDLSFTIPSQGIPVTSVLRLEVILENGLKYDFRLSMQ